MDKQRILREAQIISSQFSFWMVSGNISHLYGYAFETPEQKYIAEVKFDDNFPNSPPQIITHQEIKDLLGELSLDKLRNWTPEMRVVDIIKELKAKIQTSLQQPKNIEQDLVPIKPPIVEYIVEPVKVPTSTVEEPVIVEIIQEPTQEQASEEFITPDYTQFPEEDYYVPQETLFAPDAYKEGTSVEETPQAPKSTPPPTTKEAYTMPVEITTELGLIQMEYPIDQKGLNMAEINVYLTITLEKTFIIEIDFSIYPEKPKVYFPPEVVDFIGEPEQAISYFKKWSSKSPIHIVDIIREIEKKLFFVKDIDLQYKKVLGEYQAEAIDGNIAKLSVHLVTYGFKEYLIELDISKYPDAPIINYTSELKELVKTPPDQIEPIKRWKPKSSEVVDVLREVSWLVDKNSRVNFEINLLKGGLEDIVYDGESNTINVKMKGKMRTENIVFEFQAILPPDYPSKPPEIKVLNELDESQEGIKVKLESSIQQYFSEWSTFAYLVDLFNVISKKIFEVSVISCVICHQIECPDCSSNIASQDGNQCRVECPHCERLYHKHCWEKTMESFGKCGFCLQTPPPSMYP